ncbi:MAG: hypothetical protein ACJ77K_15260 [Bacteroidia bacterium]
MKSLKLFLLITCFPSMIFAQQDLKQSQVQFINKHLVRSDASIVAGFLIKHDISNVHLDGSLEYYLDNRVSVRGSASYMLGSSGLTKDSMGLKDFHTIMLGGAYHFHTNNHFDPYLIIQPGVAYTSSYKATYTHDSNYSTPVKQYEGVLSPLGTAGLGFNYYFQRFAHLYMETRYVYGRHLSSAPSVISLQELRITFGLGFNLFIIKDKKIPGE